MPGTYLHGEVVVLEGVGDALRHGHGVLADARFPGDDTERRARGGHGLGAGASGDASRRVALASAERSGSHGSRHCAGCARRRRRATRCAARGSRPRASTLFFYPLTTSTRLSSLPSLKKNSGVIRPSSDSATLVWAHFRLFLTWQSRQKALREFRNKQSALMNLYRTALRGLVAAAGAHAEDRSSSHRAWTRAHLRASACRPSVGCPTYARAPFPSVGSLPRRLNGAPQGFVGGQS